VLFDLRSSKHSIAAKCLCQDIYLEIFLDTTAMLLIWVCDILSHGMDLDRLGDSPEQARAKPQDFITEG
jgi:hypothetical protein